jgi:hypothetical protein
VYWGDFGGAFVLQVKECGSVAVGGGDPNINNISLQNQSGSDLVAMVP